ncbi:hypothetical protein B0H13DRAFT_1861417 [Mycena leptocephala]|nr:hypothetical protein B0H13DRAFT_1861417 [Mycena leptocephala]
MQDFPQELIDQVLDDAVTPDLVHSPVIPGPRDIGNLGLVCQKGLPRSRFHLFSQVTLREATVEPFFDLVRNSKFSLLSAIRTLELHFCQQRPLLDEDQMDLLRQSFNLVCLHICIPELVEDMQFGGLQSQASILGNTIPTVPWLILGFRTLPNSVIVSVITCFPALQKLALTGDKISAEGISDAAIPALPPRIDTLKFHVPEMEAADHFFGYLLPLPVRPILRNIKFNADPLRRGGTLEEYFKRAGHEIIFLELEGAWRWGEGSGWYRIYKEQPDVPCAEIVRSALEHTPNLQNLSIVGELPLLDILSAVSSSILISIRIYYYIVQGNELRLGSSWTAVRRCSCRDQILQPEIISCSRSLSLAEGWQNLHLTGTPEVDNEMPLRGTGNFVSSPAPTIYLALGQEPLSPEFEANF